MPSPFTGLFIGTHLNRLDAKGRVSVPAPFRQALETGGDGTVTCFPSAHNTALEAMGTELVASLLAATNKGYATFSQEGDAVLVAMLGRAERLKWDSGGRVQLPSALLQAAALGEGEVAFLGLGLRFQIWHPEKLKIHQEHADSLVKSQALALPNVSFPGMGGQETS